MLSWSEIEAALKAALGVLVGFGVLVGGTNENGVFVETSVKVGRGVLVGVMTSVGLGVQVASSCRGVGDNVGVFGPSAPGDRIFREESGLIKISAK